MQKRDNVSFGGIIYGKLRKMFAEKDSAGVIETAYEVMNSEEYKNSEEELRRIVMKKRGEGSISNNAKNDNADIHNANSNVDAVVNSTDNNVINNTDNAGDKGQEFSINESNMLNKGDGEFNAGDENTSAQNNIDTDNALSENDAVNADGIDEVGDVGSEADSQKDTNIESNINSIDKSEFEKNDYLIANGEKLEYKYNKDKTFNITLLKSKRNRAYFWSGTSNGIGDLDYAADVAKKNNGITLEMLVENNKVSLPKWDFNNPTTVKAWANASALYAKQASGEIRALIGIKLRENNFWENIELPRLMDNPDVTKIILIDPETLIETIIYEVKNENNRN